MKISIIVPCYNEENNVDLIYEELINKVKEKKKELIFINDGSKDNTFINLEKLVKKSKENIKVINFSRNFGKEAAIYAGLKESGGEYVSIIDADLQQDPNIINEMINYLENNNDYDCVAAFQETRKENKVLSFFKDNFYKLINKISDIEFVQGASDFRTLRRTMVNSILELNEKCRFSKGIFSWVGYKTHYMPYEVKERATGNTSWNFYKLFKYAMDGITSFSTFPLFISSITGLILLAISFIYILIKLIKFLIFGYLISTGSLIIFLILLVGGTQLIILGLIGNYIAQIHKESKNRPVYIAKNILYSRGYKND